MAGQGPAPKPKDQRRRRNKTNELELPAEGYQGEYPPLPATWSDIVLKKVETGDGEHELVPEEVKVTFLGDTREWYEAWATSPMATEFTAVDWQRLKRVAILVDKYGRRPSKDLLAEVRLQEQEFGGTPLARRRLGRTIASPKEEGDDGDKGDGSKSKKKRRRKADPKARRRAKLEVVK